MPPRQQPEDTPYTIELRVTVLVRASTPEEAADMASHSTWGWLDWRPEEVGAARPCPEGRLV